LCVALVISLVPLLISILGDAWRALYSNIIDFPFMVAILWAIHVRLRRAEDAGERRFWKLLSFGFCWWLVALLMDRVAGTLLADAQLLLAFVINLPYLVCYVVLAVTLEIRPHVRYEPLTHLIQTLDRVGAFVLLLGLLAYFVVVPGLISGYDSTFWASLYTLFVTLDVYLVLRLWQLREAAEIDEWRAIYTWLMVAVATWGLSDLLWSLQYEGILIHSGWAAAHSLILPLAFSAIVVASRVGAGQSGSAPGFVAAYKPLGMGPLIVYALTPLVLHVALYRFAEPDSASRMFREVLVLGITAILAGIALAYHRLLRVENSRLAEERARGQENLAHQAFHDELTGLPNRNLFRDRLGLAIEDSVRYQNKCGVLFCDLDKYMVINDSLGHEAGDHVLVAIAKRLQATIRKQDTVARFGGDEFAVIAHGLHQPLDAAFLAEKLLAAIREPLLVGGKDHVLTASIGIAVFPDDGTDVETLLKHADTAMYQSKLQGRNSYQLFTRAMNEAAMARLAIEQGLRTALIENRFAVFYQPVFELATERVVAYEALLRWRHPRRGYILPGDFIEVAEQTGLIVPIGKWVLEAACAWAAQLEPVAGVLPAVSVNVSARQFRDPELALEIRRIIQSTGLDASRLQLEITETMALALDSTAQTLHSLREMGIGIAIDDFGTGYAALSLLQDLPVDTVKIDKAFVKGIEADSASEAIVRAIVSMAKALDFYVIADGVETKAELIVVKQTQCDAAQGFYLSKPQSPEELRASLNPA
jgi:diguanylate cyclase (GGDEF)-like protein